MRLSLSQAPYISYGKVSFTVGANSASDVQVDYGHSYASPPSVVASVNSWITSVTTGSNLSVIVKAVYETYALLRLYNLNQESYQAIDVTWAAFGK